MKGNRSQRKFWQQTTVCFYAKTNGHENLGYFTRGKLNHIDLIGRKAYYNLPHKALTLHKMLRRFTTFNENEKGGNGTSRYCHDSVAASIPFHF